MGNSLRRLVRETRRELRHTRVVLELVAAQREVERLRAELDAARQEIRSLRGHPEMGNFQGSSSTQQVSKLKSGLKAWSRTAFRRPSSE